MVQEKDDINDIKLIDFGKARNWEHDIMDGKIKI